MNFEKTTTIIQIITILAASIGVYCQIDNSNNSSKLATATNLYDTYLEFAFDNPKFADGYDYDNQMSCDKEKQQYTWYVSRLLFISEEILKLDLEEDNKREWCSTIYSQFLNHKSYLLSGSFSEYRSHYTDDVKEMFDNLKVIDTRAAYTCK